MSLLPIRKIVLGALTSAVVYGAHRAGLNFGPQEVAEALAPLSGFIVAYAVKDPRVAALLQVQVEAEDVAPPSTGEEQVVNTTVYVQGVAVTLPIKVSI